MDDPRISNISVLKNLTALEHLVLSSNNISDISSLEALTNLTYLDLVFNNISDISALQALTNLTYLGLSGNNIENLTPLARLTLLERLLLNQNPAVDNFPTVEITVPPAVQGGAFNVTVTFSEVVTDFVQADLSVSGAGATITNWVGETEGEVWTATITPTEDGTVIFNVVAGVAQGKRKAVLRRLYDANTNIAIVIDFFGFILAERAHLNDPNTAAADQTVQVDVTRPTVSIGVPSSAQSSAFDVTVEFNEPVTDFVQSDLVVSGAGATVTAFSGSGTTYTATITPTTEGTVTLSVAAEVAQDAAENKNTAATDQTVEVDMTRPSVSINVPTSVQNSAFTVTVVFDEAVTGFVQNELSVSGAGATVTTFSGSGTTYTATITPTQSGTVTLSVAANVASDDANNGNTAATTKTVTVDRTRPGVSIRVPSDVQGSAFTVTVVFTESVTGFVRSELSVSGAGATVTSFSGSGTTYTATITPTQSGTVTLSVAANVAQDDADNDNTAATRQTVTVDRTRPGVSIRVPSDVQSSAFTVTVVFTESVTGFVRSELRVSGAGATVTAFSGSGTTYTATITPTQSGTVTLSVAANVASDDANNGNTAATTKTVTVDRTRPGVSIRVPSDVQSSAFTVTVVFTESVTGFVRSELRVSGAGATVTTFSGSGTTYTATITPTQSGTVTLNVAANVAQDNANNGNTAATQTVTVDMTRPSVSIRVPTGEQSGTFDVTIVFTESVTGFEQSELSVSGPAGATITARKPQTGGTDYRATIMPIRTGRVTLNVAANVAQDNVGHGNTAAPEKNVSVVILIDIEPPCPILLIEEEKVTGPFKIGVRFTEPVVGFEREDIVMTGTLIANITDWEVHDDGPRYTVEITPTPFRRTAPTIQVHIGTVTIRIYDDVAEDLAGNSSKGVDIRTIFVTFGEAPDLSHPSPAIKVPKETQTGSFEIKIIFPEPVNGFTQEDIRLMPTDTEITNWVANADRMNYTATIVPQASGTVSINIRRGVAHDDAGNPSADANGKVVTVVLPEPSPAPSLQARTLEGYIEQLKALKNPDAVVLRLIQKLENRLAALVPQQTTLLPNYPNPFNPETWIPYQLAEAAEVTVTVYAADGRVVRRFAIGHRQAGYYTDKARAAYWDGRNAAGEPVASGVYFYVFRAGNFHTTRKMLLKK